MSSQPLLASGCPVKGVYVAPKPSDIRSPCPLINCIANHGYISRDGKNIHVPELVAAMNEIGLSTALGAVFARPIFLEHRPPKTTAEVVKKETAQKKQTFLGYIWYLIRNPWAVLFSAFGMRGVGQFDAKGKKVLNLDQLALPGVVEHDISLTRDDIAQGDNLTKQPDLVDDLLKSSSDGGKTITVADFAALRKRRIDKQKADNPDVNYGNLAHQIACTEIALVLGVFGDGKSIPWDYAQAFFKEERLPVKEGWKKRKWWSLGFMELNGIINQVKSLIGVKIV